MTGYVSTRYYRAPEIMLTWQKYDVAGAKIPFDMRLDHVSWRVQWISGAQAAFSRRCWRGNHCSLAKIVCNLPVRLLRRVVTLLHTDVNQFSIITELLGTPPDDVIQTICSENVC